MVAAPDVSNNAGAVLRLPKIENSIAVCLIKIIRKSDCFGPVAAPSVCDPQNPGDTGFP